MKHQTFSAPLLLIKSALTLCVLAAVAPAQDPPSTPEAVAPRTVGRVERLDARINELIAPDAQIEVLADGFEWAEGPVWLPSEGCVVFSDIPRNTVFRWDERSGLSVYLKPSGFTGGEREGESGSNGLTLDRQGRLLLCQHGDRRVARMAAPLGAPAADYETLVSDYQGKRFNSPNDLVVHSSGAVFFTDPPYGLVKQLEDPARELDFQGVYRLDPDGSVHLLTKELARPNGIALSPDESTLYVAQSHTPNKIYMAYTLDDDLGLAASRVLFDANELGKTRPGSPDGLKIDAEGNLFATGPGGVLVLTPAGEHLGTIMPGELTANCGFGDDGRTLYLTSDRYLCRIRLSTIGQGFESP